MTVFHDLAAGDATAALPLKVIIAVGRFPRDLHNELTSERIAAAHRSPSTARTAGCLPRPRRLDRGPRTRNGLSRAAPADLLSTPSAR